VRNLKGPESVPRLRGPEILTEARAADGRTFMAASARAVVWGTGDEGVRSVLVGGEPILDGISTSAGVCRAVRLSPGRVRRELSVAGTLWVEDVLALPAHPCAVFQWTHQNADPGDFTLAWDIPGVDPGTCSADGRFLAVESEGSPHLVFCMTPEPETWSVQKGADGTHVTSRVKSGAEGVITLAAVRASDERQIQNALGALKHLTAHEARLSNELEEARRSALTVATEEPAIDRGFEWSKARLRATLQVGGDAKFFPIGTVGAPSPARPARCERLLGPDLLWTVLGWLATGDFSSAERGVRALVGHEAFGWACGQYTCWSGDDRILGELATTISGWSTRMVGVTGRPAGYGGRGHVALADAYDGLRDRTAAAFHRQAADALDSVAEPTVPADARALSISLANPSVIASGLGLDPGGGLALDASSGPTGGRDHVYDVWRNLVTAGSLQAGVWTCPPGTESHRTALAALVPAGFLFGVLGAKAEATAGRLHLAPHIPPHRSKFSVANIRVGTALVHMTYEREGRQHTFSVEQSEGATPINLVLRPGILTGSTVEASVDGVAADLDWNEESAGLGWVQAQLPLDTTRTLTLRVPRARPGAP
jgi:hypothetical protein